MNEPERTLTTADIERAVSRSVIKTLLWCLLVIPVVFALLGLIVILLAASSGTPLTTASMVLRGCALGIVYTGTELDSDSAVLREDLDADIAELPLRVDATVGRQLQSVGVALAADGHRPPGDAPRDAPGELLERALVLRVAPR